MGWQDEIAVHCTHADNLTAIREVGLRPASYWIDQAINLDERKREALRAGVRPEAVTAIHPGGQRVWLRDQEPMVRRNLTRVLVSGITETDFIAALNRRVYLFPSRVAAQGLIDKYRRAGSQVVLSFAVRSLLEEAGPDQLESLLLSVERVEGTSAR